MISDDHGRSWKRDIDFTQVKPDSSILPMDGPGLCSLDADRVLVVLQGNGSIVGRKQMVWLS